MKLLSSSDKKKIVERLKEQFGIDEIPWLLLKFGEEKIRAFSGSITKEELSMLDKNFRIETAGIYLAHVYEDEIRLSLDAIHLLKDKITKNIIELDKEQADDWFSGKDIQLKEKIERGFVILKFKDDFIGCGKSTGDSIKNYMPKERRIKS